MLAILKTIGGRQVTLEESLKMVLDSYLAGHSDYVAAKSTVTAHFGHAAKGERAEAVSDYVGDMLGDLSSGLMTMDQAVAGLTKTIFSAGLQLTRYYTLH